MADGFTRHTDGGHARVRAAAELELRGRVGTSFRSFVVHVNPSFQWHRHCIVLGNALEQIAAGTLKRLMVFMPPRHGKSEQVSRLFPAYYLYRNPTKTVGLTSYGAELATGLSKDARKYYVESGKSVRFNASAAREWRTEDGGMMWATGVGGALTGRGFSLGIIDDPLKNLEEAESAHFRTKQLEWYDSTFYTRREPDAAIILIQTRWHEDDLAGRLLQREEQQPEHWHIVNFEALKDASSRRLPATCTVEPDWRVPGEALCPERFTSDELNATRRTIGARFFLALYQQRPTLETGTIWKREWFQPFRLGEQPALLDVGSDWDLAYTEKDSNSASAFVKAGRDAQGNIFVLDLGFRWLEFPEMIRWMKTVGAPHFIEAKASGKSAKQTLTRELISATEVTVRGGDKIARMRLATPIAENRKVFVAAHLLEILLDDERQGILKFPNASHDDLNDAFVQCLNRLKKVGPQGVQFVE